MNIIATVDLEMDTLAELAAFYNKVAEKPVKRFADRKSAARRIRAELDALAERTDRVRYAIPTGSETFDVVEETPVEPEFDAVDQELMDRFGRCDCPSCGVHLSNGVLEEGDDGANGEPPIKMDHFRFECMGCGHEFGPVVKRRKTPSASPERAAAIAASWTDAETARKRKTRHVVRVTDAAGRRVEYGSVRKAFIALGLPLGQHIKFRMALKAAGNLEGYGMKWEAIQITE